MNLSKLFEKLMQVMHDNGPEILTAMGVVGVGATAVLAAKGAPQAKEALEVEKEGRRLGGMEQPTAVQTLKVVWPFYLPAVVSGVGTVSCIILASKGNAKRTAAAVTAYSVTERAFSDYREKMVEELGRNKDQKVLDAVAHQQVMDHPPPPANASLIVLGRDEVLCCELFTMRYFRSSMETLQKTVNEINRYLNYERKIKLSNFYAELGLPETDVSTNLGWTDERLLELEYSHGLTDDGRPYLSFKYNPMPEPLV